MIVRTSIIIPTFHRLDSLKQLLRSLVKEAISDCEVIVVEQGTRNEKEILKFAKNLKLQVRYVFLSKPSMTGARNAGAKIAKGKYLLFLDDDVVARSGLIKHHIQNFDDPKVGATCGRCITDGQIIEESRTDTGRINWLGQSSDGFSSAIGQEIDTVIGCNMCFRKDVFDKLGGMDEHFTGNALREDTDLSLRAKNAGYRIVFDPLAVIEHRRADSGGARKTEGRIGWYFDFFSNETYYFLKHRHAVLLPVYLVTKIEWAIRCMFGFGREVSGRSLVTPFLGILDGIHKYKEYKMDSRLRGNDKRNL